MQRATGRTKARLRDTDGPKRASSKKKQTIIYIKALTENKLVMEGLRKYKRTIICKGRRDEQKNGYETITDKEASCSKG